MRVPGGGNAVAVVMRRSYGAALGRQREAAGVSRASGESNGAARLHRVERLLQVSARRDIDYRSCLSRSVR